MRHIELTLPDGSKREVPEGTTALEVAKSISHGLAKKVLVADVDGRLTELSTPLTAKARLTLLTWDDALGKSAFWHSSAHLLAEAVQELYPDTQVTIGPAIDNGFYYDFARDEPFSTKDLEAIEKRMAKIVIKRLGK